MASIASLAVKVSANIGNLTSTLKSVTSSIDNIARSAAKSSPSMKNLEDASRGLAVMTDALGKAQEQYQNSSAADLVKNQQILTSVSDATQKLRENVERMGAGVADDILNIKVRLASAERGANAITAFLTNPTPSC